MACNIAGGSTPTRRRLDPTPHKVNMTSLEKTVAQAHEFLTCLLLRMGPDSPEFVAAAQTQENDILTCIASMSSIGIEIITRVHTDINKGLSGRVPDLGDNFDPLEAAHETVCT